ncbi:MAG: glycosyl transferase [Acidobacteria bacterium RIFCSPLOWO2_12_FULL_67_14]|nr:MAG: glycosyl transferase [Acidobacteria bacterium RIFCSPLOWO2_02_FULL_67_21]OFW38050.1 MAG: glycosyl transferase [Acidobacteria bacterium RIFCSPLOWO2_12_FULL_67_14]
MPGDGAAADRFDVLGVPVSALTRAHALDTIDLWIRRRTPHYVCVTGVHGVMESQRDEELRKIHEMAGMVTPDGMPLVWLAHAKGLSSVERVYGPDLMLACCEAGVSKGYRHFLYGGAPGVGERIAQRLSRRFPGLVVAGMYSPPFRPLTSDEDAALVDRINETRPDIVWVGLSTPKQERWMAAHVGRVEAPVLIGVGAAFDFHAGIKRQAPRWMQRSGLEWSFRLATEPRRLWKRYATNNPQFVWKIAIQMIGGGGRGAL